MKVQILQAILDAHQASEIADDMNFSSEEEAAEFYFNESYYEGEWEIDNMPKYNQFVKSIEGGDLYYDYGANYYFLVRETQMNESKKQVIRLTESQIHSIIKETVNKILREQEDTSWFTGDYTEEEKKSMEKKEKNTKRAKKAAETRLQKKKEKERKEEEEFLNTQKKRGYKGLFGNKE